MKTFIFSADTILVLKGVTHRIARVLEKGKIQLEALSDGAISNVSRDSLLAAYANRDLVFPSVTSTDSSAEFQPNLERPLSTFPECVQRRAMRKKHYLDKILQRGKFVSTPMSLAPVIEAAAREINDASPPSPITIYRWVRVFIVAERDSRALIDKHYLKGGSGTRLHPKVCEIVSEAIDEIYLNEGRNHASEVVSGVLHRITLHNEKTACTEKLEMPSRATIYRAINELDKYDVALARYGKRIADVGFRISMQGVRPKRILERVEIDHTPFDLFVVDALTNLPLGRPTVTVAIDAYSKMIVGFHIGFDGTSIESVFACLRNAILPKAYVREAYPEIENDWPCYGTMGTLVCDNGLEFHSPELERVAFELWTEILFCPKKKPYYKGSIERFLKTLNYQFSLAIPGRSFAKYFQRQDYDPLKDAVVSLQELNRLLHKWIIDVYAKSLHRGINAQPYQRWIESAAKNQPRLPPNHDRFDVCFRRSIERTLFHYGIELNNIRYNDTSLQLLRMKHGEKFTAQIRYDVNDVSYIHVLDPSDNNPLLVPAVNQDYTKGLSLVQHKMICAHVRDTNEGIIDDVSIARAKAEIRNLIKEFSSSRSLRKRTLAAKIRTNNKTEPSVGTKNPETTVDYVNRRDQSSSHRVGNEQLPSVRSDTLSRPSNSGNE